MNQCALGQPSDSSGVLPFSDQLGTYASVLIAVIFACLALSKAGQVLGREVGEVDPESSHPGAGRGVGLHRAAAAFLVRGEGGTDPLRLADHLRQRDRVLERHGRPLPGGR